MVILKKIIDTMVEMSSLGLWKHVVYRIVNDEYCPTIYGDTVVNTKKRAFPIKTPECPVQYFNDAIERYFADKIRQDDKYYSVKNVIKTVTGLFRQMYEEQIMYTGNGKPILALNYFILEVVHNLNFMMKQILYNKFTVINKLNHVERFIKYSDGDNNEVYDEFFREAMDLCAFIILFARAVSNSGHTIQFEYRITDTMLCKIVQGLGAEICCRCLHGKAFIEKNVPNGFLPRKMFDYIIDSFDDIRSQDKNHMELMLRGAIRKAYDDADMLSSIHSSDLVQYNDSQDEDPCWIKANRKSMERYEKKNGLTYEDVNEAAEPYQKRLIKSSKEGEKATETSEDIGANLSAFCGRELTPEEKAERDQADDSIPEEKPKED